MCVETCACAFHLFLSASPVILSSQGPKGPFLGRNLGDLVYGDNGNENGNYYKIGSRR